MTSQRQARGQALVIIALAAVILFGFAALAIDGSRVFSDRRNAQNAADTAVLAAALAKVRNQDYVAAAEARAASNGYVDDSDSSVEVNLCSAAGIACQGLPPGADASEYIQVKIISTIPTTFARVIGRETVTSAAEAIARVQGSSSTSSFPGEAIVALKKEGCGICAGGSLELHVLGSGIFSNSTDACAPPQQGSMDFDDGIGVYESEGGYTMPAGGALCKKPYPATNVTGDVKLGQQITSLPFSIPAPAITCSGNYDQHSAVPDAGGALVYPPGNYSAKLTLESTAEHKFINGNYCFGSGVLVKGAANVSISNANFRLDGGSFDAGGGSGTGTFGCSNLMVYGAPGSTGIHFSGNGQVTCSGVTFYMETGGITWNGNSNSYLKAPTSGPYKGLLMYLPETAENRSIKINGNSANEIVGSIIAPSSEVILSGNSGSSGYNTQIISAYVTLQGSSNTIIDFDPSVLYDPPASPTIELTK